VFELSEKLADDLEARFPRAKVVAAAFHENVPVLLFRGNESVPRPDLDALRGGGERPAIPCQQGMARFSGACQNSCVLRS
jgi:hypothetical protein